MNPINHTTYQRIQLIQQQISSRLEGWFSTADPNTHPTATSHYLSAQQSQVSNQGRQQHSSAVPASQTNYTRDSHRLAGVKTTAMTSTISHVQLADHEGCNTKAEQQQVHHMPSSILPLQHNHHIRTKRNQGISSQQPAARGITLLCSSSSHTSCTSQYNQ